MSANLTGELPADQREGFYWGPTLKGFGLRLRRTAIARKVARRIKGASRLGGRSERGRCDGHPQDIWPQASIDKTLLKEWPRSPKLKVPKPAIGGRGILKACAML